MHFGPVVGLSLLGSGMAAMVFLAPEALYLTAAVALTLCVLLFTGALVVHRANPRAEPPAPDRMRSWIDQVHGSDGPSKVRRLLLRLGRWPHMLGDVGEEHRQRVAALVQETGSAPTLRQWAGQNPRDRRIGALHLLAWLRVARSEATLVDALQHDDPDVAHAAASALAELGTASAYDQLLSMIETGPVPPSRLATLLEDAPPDLLVPMLEERFQRAGRNLRFWIAHLAGRTGSPHALSLVIRLSRDPVEDVRANAAESLGFLRDEAARERLHELLTDGSWIVQAHAAKGLRELGPAASAPLLTRLLTSSHWWVRENAIRALQSAGREAESPVRQMLPELSGDAHRGAMDVLRVVS